MSEKPGWAIPHFAQEVGNTILGNTILFCIYMLFTSKIYNEKHWNIGIYSVLNFIYEMKHVSIAECSYRSVLQC